jgi:hypothetical protein
MNSSCKGMLALSLSSAVLLSGCSFDLPVPPPVTSIGPPPISVTRSTLSMPITINADELKANVIKGLRGKRLFEGKSPELSAKLLAQEKTVFQNPKKVIEVPYKAAECPVIRITRTFTEPVKVGVEAFDCWLKPWKLGKCVRDVFENQTKTVTEDVKKCVPATLEVVRTDYTTVVTLSDKVFDTSVVLNYHGDLKDMSMKVVGNTISTRIAFDVPVSADLKTNTLAGNVTAKGALTCSSRIEVDGTIKFDLEQVGTDVLPKAEVQGLETDIKKLCIPGAVQLQRVWSYTSAEAFAMNRLVASEVEKQLKIAANEAVSKAASDLSIQRLLSETASKLNTPVKLGSDVWLDVVPTKVLLSQIKGSVVDGRQNLIMTAGLEVDLSVLYGAKPPSRKLGQIPVSLGASGDAFHLVPRGKAHVTKLREVIESTLNNHYGAQLKSAGYSLAGVNAYQSGKSIVFGVAIKGTKMLRPSAIIYLSGKPRYDIARGALVLDNFDLTLETKNWLLRNLAALRRDSVVKALANRAVIDIDGQLNDFLKQYKEFAVPISGGAITGKITSAKISGFWMEGDALNFDLVLDGSSQLRLGK